MVQLLLHWRGCGGRSDPVARLAPTDPLTIETPFAIIDYRLHAGDDIVLLATLKSRGLTGRRC